MTKSIFFIMPNLGGGGGERVISILLNNLDRSKYNLHLVLLKESKNNEFLKDLKNDIAIYRLKINVRIKYSFPIVIARLLKLVKVHSPDILFFGSGQINALISPFLFLFSKDIRLIARESNLPSIFEKYFIIKLLYRYCYSNYDVIVVQSDDMLKDLNKNFKISKEKLFKINNPVDDKYIAKRLKEISDIEIAQEGFRFLAVGRLTFQKGFDILIAQLAKIKSIPFNLYVLGEGEDLDKLKRLSHKHDIGPKIHFLGNVSNPYLYMYQVDGLILSSRFEGFPNVVLESLVCGTPVLANNCLGGIEEIIRPGFNGEIFSFTELTFKEGLNRFIKTSYESNQLKKDVINRFSVERKILEFQSIL